MPLEVKFIIPGNWYCELIIVIPVAVKMDAMDMFVFVCFLVGGIKRLLDYGYHFPGMLYILPHSLVFYF